MIPFIPNILEAVAGVPALYLLGYYRGFRRRSIVPLRRKKDQ